MLHFGMKPPFSYPDFLALWEPDSLLWESGSHSALLKEWEKFNRSLRNELVRTRAVKKGKDPNKYLRGSDGLDPFIAPLAHWAANQDSPMEAESYLDKIRWEKIEELKAGHYFDIEFLAAYGLQLQILERWRKINTCESAEILERLVRKI